VRLKILGTKFMSFSRLPDVAHDAAAVAQGVRMDNKNGEGSDHMRTAVLLGAPGRRLKIRCQGSPIFLPTGFSRGDEVWFRRKAHEAGHESIAQCHPWIAAACQRLSRRAVGE